MTDEILIPPHPGPPPIPGTPEANDLVVRGPDGDPLPDRSKLTAMIEIESYERVIEGLKMSAEACMHLAKQEPQNGETWKSIGQMLDKLRLQACQLAGLQLAMAQKETQGARGNPYTWRKARDRFLHGLQQSIGGMRQLATCFRSDFNWALMAQELDRREKSFRALLYGKRLLQPMRKLILPPPGCLPLTNPYQRFWYGPGSRRTLRCE